jgi:hypothetical protein
MTIIPVKLLVFKVGLNSAPLRDTYRHSCGYILATEYLPSTHKALGSIPRHRKIKKHSI